MDFFLQDPDEVKLPPEEVRLRLIQVTLQPGSNKVKVHLELTPFQKRPNVEIIITTSSGKEAAHTSILEVMLPKMELTMHLRRPQPGETYTLSALVFFVQQPPEGEEPDPQLRQIVDTREVIVQPHSAAPADRV